MLTYGKQKPIKNKIVPLFKVFMPESVMKPLRETLMSGYIGEGPKVAEFEQRLWPWFANKNVLATNSGTSAIQLALRLANVGYGDEVISTPMTCTATNMPILAAGAKIVWADIDPWTGNIDPEDVARKITKKTKAIMCVHWGGYPCELYDLFDICKRHKDLYLIQDAAHAFGTKYFGYPVSYFPDFTCFSFQAIKEITTVDGGALVCLGYDDCQRGRLLRWYGIDRNAKGKDLRCEADITEWGHKFHMNDVAATIGLEQLKYVDENLAKTRLNAECYNNAFGDVKLHYRNDRQSSYWLYTIRVKNRDKFMQQMKEAGIMVSKVHARNDLHTCFKDSRTKLPGVDEFDAEQISIPVGWWLTEEEVNYIIEEVNANTKRNTRRRSGQLAEQLS
jgi:dTDP-4-amino-4,6-dideoxygalactose transaminase